jgi:tRNA nucleotidyltransferase/poly(A) polymerase
MDIQTIKLLTIKELKNYSKKNNYYGYSKYTKKEDLLKFVLNKELQKQKIENKLRKNIKTIKLIGNTSHSLNERTYLVGGTVRDVLLCNKAKDLDFVSSNSEKVAKKIANIIEKETGKKPRLHIFKKFGTVQIIIYGKEIEFVNPRKETYSYRSIKPNIKKSKKFLDDALRRDFTLNTLYLGIQQDDWMKVIDLTKRGIRDLEDKVLRTPRNPDTTFKDDPSRLLRLVRFSSCKGFTIGKKTLQSAIKNREEIYRVPKETIKQFIDKGILCKGYFRVMDNVKLLEELFPEVKILETITIRKKSKKYHKYNMLEHTLRSIDYVERNRILIWTILFHDIGKRKAYTIHGKSKHHELYSIDLATFIMKKYKFSNYEIRRITKLIKNHMTIRYFNQDYENKELDINEVRRFVINNGYKIIKDIEKISIADIYGSGKYIKEEMINMYYVMKVINKLEKELLDNGKFVLKINGNDVMKVLNIKPSKRVGIIIRDIKELIIQNKLKNNRQELLKHVKLSY